MIEKSLETSILLGIYESAVLMIKKNMEFVAKQGLTNQQFVILIHLAKDPNLPFLIRETHDKPMLAYELADSLGVTRANVTNLIKVLLEKKLIKQVEDKEDRRKKRLILSKKGEDLIKKMQPERLASNKKMMTGLSKNQKEDFVQYLQIVTRNLLSQNK